MKNKGQLKIQQMAFMLIAITLFFALVGMFFLTIYLSNLKQSASSLNENNALLLVTKLANSPEFSCGDAFGTEKISCIDEDKIMALKKNSKKYENFWGSTNIEIRKIYPVENPVECTQSNYPKCNIIKISSGNISSEYSNYVSMCRKDSSDAGSYDKCELALLMVSYGG